jgi:hypothetical protein
LFATIDEHEVGEIEPGFGVGNQHRRRRRRNIVERQPPRTHRADVEVSGRSAGAAVEQECHRTIGVAQRISNECDFRLQIAVFRVVERNRSGRRLEMERAGRQLDHMLGGRIGREPQGIFVLRPRRTRACLTGWSCVGARRVGILWRSRTALLRQRRRRQLRSGQNHREHECGQVTEWLGMSLRIPHEICPRVSSVIGNFRIAAFVAAVSQNFCGPQ